MHIFFYCLQLFSAVTRWTASSALSSATAAREGLREDLAAGGVHPGLSNRFPLGGGGCVERDSVNPHSLLILNRIFPPMQLLAIKILHNTT